ncbi:MAG TPA: hypothetical protein VJJ25_04845 [Nitrosopumilaceae archaeon]|nr:hypothetical protein [Nitrosopumilaceae archaeon]
MTEIVNDEKQFSVEIVNRLVTQKMITFSDEKKKYIITNEGKKFRKYMLENTGIDIDEKLEWINKKMQGYVINFMDAKKITRLIKEGFFTEKQITQIKYCKNNGQSINLGLTKIQAEILLGKPVSKEELVNDNREGF